jgi:hypothetical protein
VRAWERRCHIHNNHILVEYIVSPGDKDTLDFHSRQELNQVRLPRAHQRESTIDFLFEFWKRQSVTRAQADHMEPWGGKIFVPE